MFRLYIDTNQLPNGWTIQEGLGHNKLVSPNGTSTLIRDENFDYYIEIKENEVPCSLPISRVTFFIRITDVNHHEIIDCGEHYDFRHTSALVRLITETSRIGRKNVVEIMIVGDTFKNVKALYQKILRGHQADEPYYKITSFKRWWLVRFMRYCRTFIAGWVDMNTQMRGEA
ncbi:MAG: hypothetical protein ACNFW9_00925 [Candidatus Kerfeldbacteria bacterium]|jgi:hypothetical protein